MDPPYIVMELIRGRTLLQDIERRATMLAEIVACIGALLADALAAAHAAGIIHRDVKPSNVLIAQGGRLLLADFGVARLETEDSLVTRTGALLGTPAYMSPEQATGETATAKSDLYSLGATLYQLSTGVLPYSGSPAKVMSQIAAGALIAPVRRRAAVGPDLSRVIEQLMESDPAARPANAAAIAVELRRVAAEGGLTGDPTEELAAYFADPDGFVRDRTPAVVGALVTAAQRAVTEAKLPRALALADRASALAPEDPAVKTLVETVTEGGRASRRRRVLAAVGAGVILAGGATALAVSWTGGGASRPDAAVAIAAIDAGALDAAVVGPADAAELIAELPDAPAPPVPSDAAPRVRDAGREVARRDRGQPVDAAIAAADPVDAAPVAPPPVDAAATAAAAAVELGTIVVVNDTWCEVSLDGVPQAGRLLQRKLIRAAPGRHTVVCAQPGINATWTREVDVVAGGQVTVEGSMLPEVAVAIAVGGDAVVIGDARHPRGATIKLKPGRYHAVIRRGDKAMLSGWLSIPRVPSCRLHEQGDEIVCDP